MPTFVSHSQPLTGNTDEWVEMTVDLTTHGMPGKRERLWIAPSPEGGYVVASIPFFSYGIQFGDQVEVGGPNHSFRRVVNSSGLRTMRLAIDDASLATEKHERIHARLLEIGFQHEWHGSGYVAILVSRREDQSTVLNTFAKEVDSERMHWEVDPPFK